MLTEPKSESGKRTLLLPLAVTATLMAHRRTQEAEKGAARVWLNEWCLVFVGKHGEPLGGTAVLRAFQAHLAAVGLPKVRFHDLRLTAINRLAAAGVHVKVAQQIAGHSNVSTTLDVYTHTNTDQQAEAWEAVGKLIGG